MATTFRNMAIRDGKEAGKNAASWAEVAYLQVLQSIEAGDLEALNFFREPDLSGEWAGDPTPQSLASDWGVNPDEYDRISDLCDLWEQHASQTFWEELERIRHYHLS